MKMSPRSSVAVVLAGGGAGTRLGSNIPKAAVVFRGTPLLFHTLRTFHRLPEVRSLVIVLPAVLVDRFALLSNEFPKVKAVIAGGRRRQDSVEKALLHVIAEEIVLIHDIARPFATVRLIRRVIAAARRFGACVPALPVTDTVKETRGTIVVKTIPRERLVVVQTPQGFQRDVLTAAYRHGRRKRLSGSDDAFFVERLGKKVVLVRGERTNSKITYPEDLLENRGKRDAWSGNHKGEMI